VDKQFGSKVDKIYCGNCYDAQFASRCDGCGEIFRAGTSFLISVNRSIFTKNKQGITLATLASAMNENENERPRLPSWLLESENGGSKVDLRNP
jgi:hypothetical protein